MCVRTSTAFYGSFILDMGRSPGFGPALSDYTCLSHSVSLRLRTFKCLTSPDTAARRTVLQKVRGPARMAVPQLVNAGFQVLFHSPHGVLFTFPSQYSALSVTKEYLALRGGPRSFPQGSTCLVVLWILLCRLTFHVRGFHPLRPAFPGPFHLAHRSRMQSEPRSASHHGLGSSRFARRYFGNHFCFLFLRLLRCFSSPGSPHTAI